MTHHRPYPWEVHYPDGVTWDAPLSLRPLPELLAASAEKYPARVAMDFFGAETNFAALQRRVERLAAALQGLGVTKGMRVGICMPNCPQFVVAYYAILKVGGVVVNLNPLYTAADIQHELRDAGVEMVFSIRIPALWNKLLMAVEDTGVRQVIHTSIADALPWHKGLLMRLLRAKEIAPVPTQNPLPVGEGGEQCEPGEGVSPKEALTPTLSQRERGFIPFASLLRARRGFSPVAINPAEDLAVLQYTGGTTGTPKAAMLTHANLAANTQQCGHFFAGMEAGKEIFMAVIPFFHSFSMTAVMNLAMLEGATLIIHPKFDVAAVLQDTQRKKPTLMCAVPTMFVALANDARVGQFDLSSLKRCVSGGAPLPLEIRKKFEGLTGCTLVEGYGLTETSPVATVNPLFGEIREGSIGIPVPHTIVEVVDADDKTTLKNVGEVGEICIRGPQVMRGYWNKPEDTAEVLRSPSPLAGEGWGGGDFASGKNLSSPLPNPPPRGGRGYGVRLHTGDLGYMDAEGYFYIVDRLKDMIISGGYNVYPRTIEEALYQHPDVAEAAVIAIPHPSRGQVAKAFVVTKPGCQLKELEVKQFLKEKLASFAVPQKVEFRENLPKTLIGKVDKKALQSQETT